MPHCPDVGWILGKPAAAALNLKTNARLSRKERQTRLPVRRGDRVALIYNEGDVLLTAPVRGNTLEGFLTSLANGLATPLKCSWENTALVYRAISGWTRGSDRLRLVRRFESGALRPLDLAGDYIHFMGPLRREAGGIWTYALEN